MVFGVEADEGRNGRDRTVGVFKIVHRDVDTDRVKEAYRRLTESAAEEMVECRLADTAVLCEIADRKIIIPIVGQVLHRRGEGFIVDYL